MSGRTIICEYCGISVHRPKGDEGRGRFCSVRCGRAAQPMPTREERFWAKVTKGDGCWEWTGWRNPGGYGLLYTGSRTGRYNQPAHRVSWEIHFGPIPPSLFVCHHCDNPPCVRPDHLWLGTPAANTQDRDRKGRHRTLRGDQHPQRLDPTKVLRGERSGRAKLTESKVREIRVRRASGERLRTIAVDYSVSEGAISTIARRGSWKHVE